MENIEIVVTTMFGIEALAAKEIRNLGYVTKSVEDGRITFYGDFLAVARANMWLRTAERVFIKICEFKAETFDELFEKTKAVDFSDWIGKDDAFPVNGFTLRSKLFSVRDCQSIIKKGIVESLKKSYNISWFSESDKTIKIEFSVIKDSVSIMIDTSGENLHKRGYRRMSNAAPLKETIAAAMVILSRFKYNGYFADPFCGSGTIPIEAALIAKNIAPGIKRKFDFEKFSFMPHNLINKAREEAFDSKRDTNLKILASDIDPMCVDLSIGNAKKAGVNDIILVKKMAVKDFKWDKEDGTMVCNPPYGERLLDIKESEKVLTELGKSYKNLKNWKLFVLTPDEKLEKLIGRRADKKRKLYNGMIKCNLYQYL